ncbi:resistance-nodulation-cell division (RND) efflux membrane fusion protein [Pseudomonas asuensis]|uniref:Resistance-nodulation-cell division (RND) efflux membrane fusion protein n=1 Tax=Pseudomonas asuensis TaxID=1825787 RepID=A0ABQ2GRQ2_9PSED|nr:efflux RND transporter periplasmic adaptor subunit [Pseudomonas asuensis]GGM08489.1 resistance-nodulation-cell division (RND) efflux membrane fusion protein [Pseudomonas asuensis]
MLFFSRRARPLFRRTAAVFLLGVSLAGMAGCSDDLQPTPQPPHVKVQRVALEDVATTTTLTGDVQARIQTTLSFRISGKINERLVDVGDHVKQGQVLARLDPQDQRNNVAAAEAQVFSLQSRANLARVQFERQKALMPKGYTTQSQYDEAQAALKGAESALSAARAQLDDARKQLSYANLVSAASGVITERQAEVGQVVQASMPIFTLAQEGDRDAVFNVQESLLAHDPGDRPIEVALLHDPAVRTTGHVREVSPVISQQSGTVRVKVLLDKALPQMALGATVTASLGTPEKRQVVLPWTALNGTVEKPAVWVLDTDNRARLKPVRVARYITGQVMIDEGLAPADRVVTAGGQLLYDGLKVEVVEVTDHAPPIQPAAINPADKAKGQQGASS